MSAHMHLFFSLSHLNRPLSFLGSAPPSQADVEEANKKMASRAERYFDYNIIMIRWIASQYLQRRNK